VFKGYTLGAIEREIILAITKIMVAIVESISSFAPTKTPMAALHHKVAPVFNPFTLPNASVKPLNLFMGI
jgi:hypothetical protein